MAYMLKLWNHCLSFLCCNLCAVKDGQKRKINKSIEKVNDVPKRHNNRMVLHSQPENILLILCFACVLNWAHVFLFDRQYFATLYASEPFFFFSLPPLVLEKGMFCLIQGLRVWQDYCEALDVTSLLFQKLVQFPLNHKATAPTINK